MISRKTKNNFLVIKFILFFSGQLWPSQNHHIHPTQQQYPLLQHHQLWPGSQPQHLQKVTFRSASHHEMLDDRG